MRYYWNYLRNIMIKYDRYIIKIMILNIIVVLIYIWINSMGINIDK